MKEMLCIYLFCLPKKDIVGIWGVWPSCGVTYGFLSVFGPTELHISNEGNKWDVRCFCFNSVKIQDFYVVYYVMTRDLLL